MQIVVKEVNINIMYVSIMQCKITKIRVNNAHFFLCIECKLLCTLQNQRTIIYTTFLTNLELPNSYKYKSGRSVIFGLIRFESFSGFDTALFIYILPPTLILLNSGPYLLYSSRCDLCGFMKKQYTNILKKSLKSSLLEGV